MLENLNTFANLVQIASYREILEQANNNDIMHELNKQNERYLKQILQNQAEILKRLERIEQNVRLAKSDRDI